MVWVYLRATPIIDHDTELADLEEKGYAKEILHSQTVWSYEQLFDYSHLHADRPFGPSSWEKTVSEISNRLVRKTQNRKVLFPVYNKRKNIGYDSGSRLSSDASSVTTFDLEKHYVESGIKIGGPCELRRQWRLNDLKPRFYYAQGGDAYHSSKYMKALAVNLMEAIPSTTLEARRNPPDFLNRLYEEDTFVVLWDLTSFTTNLSELKFFLFCVACDVEFKFGTTIAVLDLREGLIHVPLHEILFAYNESCNIAPDFDISRLQEASPENNHILQSQNNGMLGVPGNIGFSTALHGYIAASVLGFDYTVCVGDDAIGIANETAPIISTIQTLGEIETSKFSILSPLDGREQYTRFLKRRLTRNEYGLSLDYLFNLPTPPIFDGNIPEGRTPPLAFSAVDRVKSVCATVSSLLWEPNFLHADPIDDEGRQEILQYLRVGYRMMGLPINGRLPGWSYKAPNADSAVTINEALPPLTLDLLSELEHHDWLEILFNSRPQKYFTVPMYISHIDRYLVPDFTIGETFFGRTSALLRVLTDFEYIRREAYVEVTGEYSYENLRRLRRLLKGEAEMVYHCTALKDAPAWIEHFTPSVVSSDMRSFCQYT